MMLRRWLLNTVIIVILGHLMAGVGYEGAAAALLAGAFLGVVNAIIRPLLLVITLPLNLLTLGIFTFVINALMLQLTAWVVPGFAVAGFATALFAALLFSIFSVMLSVLLKT